MPYLGRGPNFGVRTVFHFLASNGDTSVSGADADGKNLNFTDGNYIDVYLNGVRLKSGEDYNTSTANTVAGLTALNANDEVNIVVYDTFTVADTVKASEGGTFGGAISVTGDVTSTGTVNVTGDTAAGDDASIGFTSAEGLILTGQGTTNDITIKNDADTSVIQIPTGTDDVNFTDDVTLKSDSAVLGFGADTDITLTHAADTGLTLNGTFTSTGLASTTSGTSNFVAGVNAGNSIASGGNYNVCIGDEAGTALTTGDQNTAVGFEALNSEDADGLNTAVGYQALKALNAGGAGYNTAVGNLAGTAMTTGTTNTLVGSHAGDAITEAADNVAIGAFALSAEDTRSGSVAIGRDALLVQNAVGGNPYNVAIGYQSGRAVTTAVECTFVGYLAGDAVTTSSGNTALGSQALGEQAGDYNTAVGRSACNGVTSSGNRNTGVGEVALFTVNSGAKNVGLGNAAGYAITSGGNNICLGVDAGRTGSPGGNITTGSNEIALGDENISSFSCQVSLTATSDERDKTDFKDLDLGLDFVNALKPVTYVWDKRTNYIDKTDVTTFDEDGKVKHEGWDLTTDLDKVTSDGSKKDDDLQVGFKAQDVIALEDAAGYKLSDKTNLTATVTSDGKQYGLRYERFVPMLVKALQELSAKNDALEARIKKLEDG